MQNIQISILNSLFSGKPGADAPVTGTFTGNGQVGPAATDPEGAGFFSFLQGLLTQKLNSHEDSVNLLGAPPPVNADSIREALSADSALIGVIKIAPKATTDPVSAQLEEIKAESLQGDALAATSAPEIAAASALEAAIAQRRADPSEQAFVRPANAPGVQLQNQTGGIAAALTAPTDTSPETGDPKNLEIDLPAELDGRNGESRFEQPVTSAIMKQSGHSANQLVTGVLAVPENAALETQVHAALSRSDGTGAIGIDRTQSQRIELAATAPDGNTHLNPVRDQIVAAVSTRLGDHKLEIRLDPPELGKVLIGFERDGTDLVRAVISADSPETLDLMRRHANVFQRALEAQGFENLDLHFADKGPGENADQEDDHTTHNFRLSDEEMIAGFVAPSPLTASGRLDRRL